MFYVFKTLSRWEKLRGTTLVSGSCRGGRGILEHLDEGHQKQMWCCWLLWLGVSRSITAQTTSHPGLCHHFTFPTGRNKSSAQALPLTFLRIPHGTENTHTLLPACMLWRSGMGRVFGWWPHHAAFGSLLSPTPEQIRATGALQLTHKAGVRETPSCCHFLKSFFKSIVQPSEEHT